MSGKRVTYLIGAGASANALPVVNGMNERMKLFYNLLFDINKNRQIIDEKSFENLYDLLDKSTTHQTIDTYVKKLWYKEDKENYNLLKRFLISYLIYEQAEKNATKKAIMFDDEKIVMSLFKKPKKFNVESENTIHKILDKTKDERYDSFFASLLNSERLLNPNVNIISWNYDLQFELSYSDFYQNLEELDEIQNKLQVFPRSETIDDIDANKSAIIKINGTGNFRDLTDKSINVFDVINESFTEDRFADILSMIFNYREGKNINNQLKFAWENDGYVSKARLRAKEIIGKSDAVVIIGYSFPTFNREVDREIF